MKPTPCADSPVSSSPLVDRMPPVVRALAVVEMLDRADRHHPVEAGGPERKPESVALDERGRAGELASPAELARREVERDGPRAAPARLARPVPVATRH